MRPPRALVTVERTLPASPAAVFAVLSDGWLYPLWVVGASHVRAVDDGWPAPGTRIHHAVGPWPVQVRDTTEVLAVEPGRLLELHARLWPVGAARVRLELAAEPGGTRVRMGEAVEAGPARVLPAAVQALGIVPRNAECLARLSDLAVHRTAPG